MSLFGNTPGASPFGNAANKPSSFGGISSSTNTATQPAGGGLFGGGTQNQQQGVTGGGVFGSAATAQPQQSGGLFGSSTAQKPATSLFGGTPQQQPQQQPQQSGGLFGSSTAQKPAGSLFGAPAQQQQTQQPAAGGGLFGGGLALGASGVGSAQQQPQQQQSSLFGSSILGGGQQQPQQQAQQPQQSQFGQTTMVQPQGQQQEQSLSSSLWSPGRAITGGEPTSEYILYRFNSLLTASTMFIVHRTVPMQIAIVRDKWDAPSQASPFRAYLYNHVGDDNAPFYQPGPEDDETKWEEALRKRPGPGYVPVLVKGFWDLGKRAQRQKDFLAMMQTRLHEINNCLTDLLSRHDLKISVKVGDARRKHIVLSKRCLALAAKTQVLRNRGYAMDDAEEELKKKLAELERSVFDASLNGRGEEIWARMLAIHEHSKRLQAEMDRAGANVATNGAEEIDEQTMKTAKKILDDYHAQIQHLQKEMESVKKEFEEAQKLKPN
ncbi:Nucleoporin NUP57 [Penicillium canariense]|uniref:Nucleoporin NUP57 n=1 Tax=Penicillium canariense TaxID=189055 RepID=A0A9W9I2R9_9EURO|nr:Nucleoporin NUP57 [Penicillium canariense]KAJ5166874.1 Nucleoporin NUP57 [Penicillium canariense]